MKGFNGKSKKIELNEDPTQDKKEIYNPLTGKLEIIKLSDYINSLFITDLDAKDSKLTNTGLNKMYKNINTVIKDETNARNLLNDEETRRTLENEEKQLAKFTEMMERAKARIKDLNGKDPQND